MPITTNVASSNVSDLRQVGGFLRDSSNKTDRHDITEILLKVELNTLTLPSMWVKKLFINFYTEVNASDGNNSREPSSLLSMRQAK